MKPEECRVGQEVVLGEYGDIDHVMIMMVGETAVVTEIHGMFPRIEVNGKQMVWPIDSMEKK